MKYLKRATFNRKSRNFPKTQPSGGKRSQLSPQKLTPQASTIRWGQSADRCDQECVRARPQKFQKLHVARTHKNNTDMVEMYGSTNISKKNKRERHFMTLDNAIIGIKYNPHCRYQQTKQPSPPNVKICRKKIQ